MSDDEDIRFISEALLYYLSREHEDSDVDTYMQRFCQFFADYNVRVSAISVDQVVHKKIFDALMEKNNFAVIDHVIIPKSKKAYAALHILNVYAESQSHD